LSPFFALTFIAALSLLGCGGGSSIAGGEPDFSLQVSPAALSVGVGDTSVPVVVTAIGLRGFSSSVTVSISGLPAGVTSSLSSPVTLEPGQNQQLVFSVPVAGPAGKFPLSFQSSSGALQHTVLATLQVLPCLPGGTDATIQAALDAGGPADLCPGSTFTVSHPIRLGSAYGKAGKIFTAGYPPFIAGPPPQPSTQGLLIVAANVANWPNDGTGPVLDAQGDNIKIQNISIDGNRRNNVVTRLVPLIRIIGHNNLLDGVYAVDTLGLSAIDVADDPTCTGSQVTNNFIGYNGIHVTTDLASLPWADGLDFRCSNARVAGNQIMDATDGGIDFFGGTNTIIESNTITNSGASAYGGLIADPVDDVDSAGHPLSTPLDFSNSILRNNKIEASNGQHLHVAIAVGTHLWCDDATNNGNCAYGTGVTFQDNQGTGLYGYGIFIGGMDNTTVLGNNLVMTPWPLVACYLAGEDYYILENATGTFQSGWVSRTPMHWPCIGPEGQ